MRSTALDGIMHTCSQNAVGMPMYKHLLGALIQTKPVPYVWDNWRGFDTPGGEALPAAITWPSPAFCLTAGKGAIAHHHRLAVFRAKYDQKAAGWADMATWHMNGVLVFSKAEDAFDVIGLAGHSGMPIVFPEIQLAFRRMGDRWHWDFSPTGPVNGLYQLFRRDFDEEDERQFSHALDYVGSIYSTFLAAWLHELAQPGEWVNFPPKPARLQYKDGKVKKVLRLPLLGYKTYVKQVKV